MCASECVVWFLWWITLCQTLVLYEREMWRQGETFKPRRVSGYKRRSDIKEECIMEVPVSLIDSLLDLQFVS